MNDDGDLKDDVKMPDGEIGDKINRLFKTDEKDTSKFYRSSPGIFRCLSYTSCSRACICWFALEANVLTCISQTSSSLLRWVRRPPLRLRRPPARVKLAFARI